MSNPNPWGFHRDADAELSPLMKSVRAHAEHPLLCPPSQPLFASAQTDEAQELYRKRGRHQPPELPELAELQQAGSDAAAEDVAELAHLEAIKRAQEAFERDELPEFGLFGR